MREIIYDIHSKRPLILGYSGEHKAAVVEFRGFKRFDSTATMYLMIDTIGLIPLVDNEVELEYAYMKNEGTFQGMLVEVKNGNTLIHKEALFDCIIKHSLPVGNLVPSETPTLQLWYAKYGERYELMGTLYNTVKAAYDSGAFKGDKGDTGNPGRNGSDGYSPTVTTSKTGKTTTITITDKNGTRTATVLDGNDGNDGEDGNDGTSVTITDISESTASGGTSTVTFSDGNTLSVKNGINGVDGSNGRDGSDAEVTSGNIASALGYTPADAQGLANTDEHIAEDIEPALEQLNDDLATKLSEPNSGLAVGKYFKVSAIDENGHAVLEACNLPIAGQGTAGMVAGETAYCVGINANNGKLSASTKTQSAYNSLSNSAFIGKGTLENIKTDLVGRALADDTAEAYSVETQNKALARLGAEKAKGEWVLKGTMTLENLLNCPVDFSGCSEFMINGRTVGTAATNLNVFDNSSSMIGTVGSITTGTERFFYFRFADVVNNIEPIVARYGTESNNKISGNLNAYIMFDNSIKNIKYFKVGNSSSVAEMELSIYAR